MNSYIWIHIFMNSYMNSESIHLNSYTWIHILMNSYIHFIYEFRCIWIHIIISYMNSYNDYMNSYMNSYKLWIHMIFSYLNSYAGHMIFSYMNWYAGHSYEFIVLACISGSQSWEHPWRISRTLPKHSYAAHGLKWSDFGKTKASGTLVYPNSYMNS